MPQRLTKKKEFEYIIDEKDLEKAINKLGQIEDFEDWMEMDILSILLILDIEYWHIVSNGKIYDNSNSLKKYNEDEWAIYNQTSDTYFKTSERNKTWEVIKEHIEND